MNRLQAWIDRLGRTPVAPLLGYPGTRLTRTSIKLNEFNWGVHAWTLQVIWRRFQPDAVFTLMDLAVEASAIGLQVRFPLFESPTVEFHPVKEQADLDQFKAADILKDGRAYAFIQTIRQLGQILPEEVVKAAYVTGPFTLAGLMMGAEQIALNAILEPNLVHRTLELATSVVTRYAMALESAGADAIVILDPTSVILGPEHFEQFAGKYTRMLIGSLKNAATVYHVCGNTMHLIERFCELGVDGLSLDSAVSLPAVARKVPQDIVLVGNIDPVSVMLHGNPEAVRREVLNLRRAMSDRRSFVLSTGCDLPPETPFENIEAFVQAGKEPL